MYRRLSVTKIYFTAVATISYISSAIYDFSAGLLNQEETPSVTDDLRNQDDVATGEDGVNHDFLAEGFVVAVSSFGRFIGDSLALPESSR